MGKDNHENNPPLKGLAFTSVSDSQTLQKEKQELTVIDLQPIPKRWFGYLSKTGPGWLQSAITLGGGTAAACLFIGATYGYSLLWVQPLAMLVAVIMFMASSHQTLSTGIKPFEAIRRFVHPIVAWAWAIATLLSTIIWHFPQYALAGGAIKDLITVFTGWNPTGQAEIITLLISGFFVLVMATFIVWNYGKGLRGIRIFEKSLIAMIWLIIISFSIVFIRATLLGDIEWSKVFSGFLPLYIPTDARGVTLVMGAFSAAVGINMAFVFGYSQLARGWGREHRALSRFDLICGMFLPYSIVVSLMVIVVALALYDPTHNIIRTIDPVEAGRLMAETGLGPIFGRIIFELGILSMVISTIIMHMLICGFVACEIFKVKPNTIQYKLACLIPAPAFLGVVLWKYMGYWIAVPASAAAGLMLPIAYIGWFILNNNKKFLGEDMPRGGRRVFYNIAMLLAIFVSLASIVFYLFSIFK